MGKRGSSDSGASRRVALIVGISLFAVVATVLLGSAALTDLEQSSKTGQGKLAMAQFDARAGSVALGDTAAKEVHLGGNGDGRVTVDAGAGRIAIEAVNGSNTRTVLDERFGAVTYETAERPSPTRAVASGAPRRAGRGWSRRRSTTTGRGR